MRHFLYKSLIVVLGVILLSQTSSSAQQQNQEPPDMYEIAAKEADRLGRILDLEDWQLFMVDSTLQYNFIHMDQELRRLSDAKVTLSSAYQFVQDKWMERTDSTYLKIFNEEQWKAYMKSGGARQKKARDKRKSKIKNK